MVGANYSFSEYPKAGKQFAAIFTKIGATLFFNTIQLKYYLLTHNVKKPVARLKK